MDDFTKKQQIVILVLVFLITLSLGFKYVILNKKTVEDIVQNTVGNVVETEDNSELDDIEDIEDIEDSIIMVHISGQVYFPGVYELVNGDRVDDAVKLAGGLTKDADLDRINLAKKLVDEEKIYIPKTGENILETNDVNYITTSNISVNDGKININTCSKSELVSLPGIGDVIADRIIEYRATNPFRTIEDILNVSGIGEKKYEGIKELITVN